MTPQWHKIRNTTRLSPKSQSFSAVTTMQRKSPRPSDLNRIRMHPRRSLTGKKKTVTHNRFIRKIRSRNTKNKSRFLMIKTLDLFLTKCLCSKTRNRKPWTVSKISQFSMLKRLPPTTTPAISIANIKPISKVTPKTINRNHVVNEGTYDMSIRLTLQHTG